MIVNIWGAPGTGKSTTAAGLFAELNRNERTRHLNIELVTEVAKDFVWESRTETLEIQLYVTSKQFRNMYRVARKVDVVITDSPVLQGVFYAGYYKAVPDVELYYKAMKMFDETLGEKMDFYLPRCVPYNETGRYQTAEEIKKFDLKFYDFMLKKIENFHHLKKELSFQDQILDTLLDTL